VADVPRDPVWTPPPTICKLKKKGKAIRGTGRGGPQGCETSRLPYFLDSWPTDAGEVRLSYPCNRPWSSIELWDVESPTFSTKSAHCWQWGCQPCAPAALYPPRRFLELISVRGWVDCRAIVRLELLSKLKNANDLIGNRTHDLSTCSLVPHHKEEGKQRKNTKWNIQTPGSVWKNQVVKAYSYTNHVPGPWKDFQRNSQAI
jgi:hypothetical protein